MNADRQANLLVVDDETGIREGCRRVLAGEGFMVDVAVDGAEALERLAARPYDLLLVDVKMPGLSGIELVARAQQWDPSIVCVMITGYATLETAIEATKSGAYDFLPKPFTPDELLAKVGKGLERRWLVLETQRLREEKERRLLEVSQEKSRLATIINCMQDGVLVTNREGLLVLYNPAAAAMLRFTHDNPIGQPIDRCLPDPEIGQLFASGLVATSLSEMLSQEIKLASGDRIVMANVAPVRDGRSEAIGAVMVLRDITSLKQIQRVKSQFVAMVAHELRAPLAAIQGYIDVILAGAVQNDPQQSRHMLERARGRAVALLEMIDDLLEVSSLEAGRISRKVERLDLVQSLRESLEMARPVAAAGQIRLVEELPSSALPINADREELARLFTNLLNNAIKYNRNGGTVDVTACSEGPYARVDVRDTGIGIPAEAVPRLFDEFYRVKSAETRQIVGTGLGLAIVKRILEANHGFIRVESEAGTGSRFTLFLPLAETVAPLAAEA